MVFLPEDEPMTSMIRLKQDKSPIIPSNIKKEKSDIEKKTCFTCNMEILGCMLFSMN